MALYPILSRLAYKKAQKNLQIVSKLRLEIGTDTYIKSCEYLRVRIKEDSLIKNLNSYI